MQQGFSIVKPKFTDDHLERVDICHAPHLTARTAADSSDQRMMNLMKTAAVQLEGVSKSFGTVKAISNLSLTVQAGEVVAVLGPNGAGKTTAISLMLGLRSPDAGSAKIFGRDPRDAAARDRIGVMLQDSDVPSNLRVSEVVELIGRYYPQPLPVNTALEMAGLSDKAGAIRDGNGLRGMRKRLELSGGTLEVNAKRLVASLPLEGDAGRTA